MEILVDSVDHIQYLTETYLFHLGHLASNLNGQSNIKDITTYLVLIGV